MLLRIFQISQENTCVGVFFLIKLHIPAACCFPGYFLHRCFPVKFVKHFKSTFFTERFWWLLLTLGISNFVKSKKFTQKKNLRVFRVFNFSIKAKIENSETSEISNSVFASTFFCLFIFWSWWVDTNFSGKFLSVQMRYT